MNCLDFLYGKSVALGKQPQAVGCVALVIRGILVLRLQKGNAQIQGAARAANPSELLQDLVGIGHVLKHGVADDSIKKSIRLGDLMERGVDVYVFVVQAMRYILIEQFAVNERANIAVAGTRIQNAALEEFGVAQ